jgi:hypothetical protein
MQGLETVNQATEEFLLRDFVDEYIIGPFLLDRVAADLSEENTTRSPIGMQPRCKTADDGEQ